MTHQAIVALLASCMSGASLLAQETDTARVNVPLFSSHETMELTLTGPFDEVFKDRDQDSEDHPAQLAYTTDAGGRDTIDVEIRTRGKFRLQRSTCNFPPLHVRFARKEAEGTPFQGAGRIKLVTHCRTGNSTYEQYVLKEYLAYRVFNLFTDKSFRVRLARITYVESEKDREPITAYGFFIEDKDEVAARAGYQVLDAPAIPPENHDPAQLSLVEVFEYLIGNTDWDAFLRGPDDDECCHNTKNIGPPYGPVYAVPYDFDWSGLVDARYARPDAKLGIRSVRQRLYRGICRSTEQLQATLQLFLARKDSVYALFRNQEGLEERELERALGYLDDFYEVISDPRRVKREMEDRCRG